MQNVKCTSNNQNCPHDKDICCQFCTLNYSPCEGKCSGCWDNVKEFGYDIEPRIEQELNVKLPIA